MESLSIICCGTVRTGRMAVASPKRMRCGRTGGKRSGARRRKPLMKNLMEDSMGGLTESKRRTCRRNHCPPSVCGVRGFPPRSVQRGATLVQAFEELGGTPFATPELTRLRITMVIRSRCPPKEQCGQVERLSGRAICGLSAEPDARMRNRPMPAGGG